MKRGKLHKEIHSIQEGKYLKSRVYGGLDGIITTFAIVAGVAGAGLSSAIILILGFANLIADGISMAMGDFLSIKSENEYYELEKKREKFEIDNNHIEEKNEMMEIYKKKGVSKKDSKSIVNIFSKNKKLWIETMMHEELGLIKTLGSPIRHGLNTFLFFILFGFIPLLLYVVSAISNLQIQKEFLITCLLAGFSMFILGSIKSKITGKHWVESGIETLIIGSIAASAAYFIGHLLSKLI